MSKLPPQPPPQPQPLRADRAEASVVVLPRWISDALIQRTLQVWQKRYKFTLSRQDAVTILTNVGRLIGVLCRG